MPNNETSRLRAMLTELRGELSRLPPNGMDDTRRTELFDLQTEIERLLARSESAGETVAPEERQRLQERLQTLVAGFEGAHPQITSVLEGAMNALSNMGL